MTDPTSAAAETLATGARILIAGGGSAGHVQPALAVAHALVEVDPTVSIIFLGTQRGLETRLVPEAGFELVTVDEVKFTRKLRPEMLRLPGRLRRVVRATRQIIVERDIDAVVGFGGYVALPAYLAARGRAAVVVHEANARAGIANRIGARFADAVLTAVPDTGLRRARVIGNPVRRELSELDRPGLRRAAREYFGLDPDRPTLVVLGGSLGAVVFNKTFPRSADDLDRAGIQVLHIRGRGKDLDVPVRKPGRPPYLAREFVDRMDLLYAAADLLVARSGAMTVAEVAAVGVPVLYVPLAFGNGEQRLNAAGQLASGAARLIDEADLTVAAVREEIIPLVTDPAALAAMAGAAASGTDHADEMVARVALAAARQDQAQKHQAQKHQAEKDQAQKRWARTHWTRKHWTRKHRDR